MSVIIKAHFDGKTIVPDSHLDLPVDQPMEVELRLITPAEHTDLPKSSRVTKLDITKLTFFGMWKDREDMSDSVLWVQREREKWSKRYSNTD